MHGVTIKGIPYYRCDECKNTQNMRDRWVEIKERIRTLILEPDRLVPGIRAQLENGKTIERLELEKERLETEVEKWMNSREKARRLYLISESYSEGEYLDDDKRMEDQQRKTAAQVARVTEQISHLRQAMVDEEGIRDFCKMAAQNLEAMDDAKWRLLLERMRFKMEVTFGEKTRVYLSLPVVREPDSEIVYQTSRC
jgi:hypothetical protein